MLSGAVARLPRFCAQPHGLSVSLALLSVPQARPWVLPFHDRELLTEGQVFQGDFPDIPWQKMKTQKQREKYEHAEKYRKARAEKSTVFRQI
jgi:hypothetical protein